MDHLGIHDLAHDRASDWLDCNDQSERDQIANRYRKELKSAVMWGTAAIALDTALHTLLAQISIWGLTATTAAFHLATDYPWESAVVVGVVVTIWRLRRR